MEAAKKKCRRPEKKLLKPEKVPNYQNVIFKGPKSNCMGLKKILEARKRIPEGKKKILKILKSILKS